MAVTQVTERHSAHRRCKARLACGGLLAVRRAREALFAKGAGIWRTGEDWGEIQGE
jgi:hypothetical protein